MYTIKTIIKLQEKKYNNDIIITDLHGNEIIILNKQGNMVIMNCTGINNITIVNQTTDKCYDDVPIKFQLNLEEKDGYLRNNGIIMNSSSKGNCNKIKIINLPNNQQLYVYNHIIHIINNTKSLQRLNLVMDDIHNWNTSHIDELVNNTGVVSKDKENNFSEEELFEQMNEIINNEDTVSNTFPNIIWNKIKQMIIVATIIITCALTVIIMIKIIVYLIKRKKKREQKRSIIRAIYKRDQIKFKRDMGHSSL